MKQTEFARVVAVALEIAGYADRGLGGTEPSEVRDLMDHRDVKAEHFHDVMLLADAFMGFAMNVRAAAKKGKPIIPVVGETDLPR